MGVLEPVDESFANVPATPPGVQELGVDEDIFSETGVNKKPPVNTFKGHFFGGILPVIPYKEKYDFIQETRDVWSLRAFTTKKNEGKCPTCKEDVKRDLKRLEQFVQKCKTETDDLRAENESLKKELEELRIRLNLKETDKNNKGKLSFSKHQQGTVSVFVEKNNIYNSINFSCNKPSIPGKDLPELEVKNCIKSFSVSLPTNDTKSTSHITDFNNYGSKNRKSVAQLRKEFFEKEFKSEQKIFRSENCLEIKAKENKDTFRSRLTITVKPKPRISEIISKLTSGVSTSKIIPEVAPVTMFQRFEKTKIVWESGLMEKDVLQKTQ